ncbi:unnamed protein product, partial [Mesorhabditis belari]|uniref:U1 small nuclear ribonucleoprotein C n=1 Tax=Mesorhabditis belari TaxID=2138241 RepID=A0AAF3J6I8_9BILA
MKFYCDYCDTFLTHDSPSVRKTHNQGRKHKENVREFYQKWMEAEAQKLVDATAKAFAAQRPGGPLGLPTMRAAPFMPMAPMNPMAAYHAPFPTAPGMNPYAMMRGGMMGGPPRGGGPMMH